MSPQQYDAIQRDIIEMEHDLESLQTQARNTSTSLDTISASGEELTTTSDIVTDALTAFGLEAEDSSHFADVLAAASSNANTNVGMMGETFKYVAPVAGALGYTVEDTATVIGVLANNGIKSSQAGTVLRKSITSLVAPSKKATTQMQKLGFYASKTIEIFNQ